MAKRPRLGDLDLTSFDLTGFDIAAMLDSDGVRVARSAVEITARAVRETTYVTVGLTILGVQRAQVRRREFERSLRR